MIDTLKQVGQIQVVLCMLASALCAGTAFAQCDEVQIELQLDKTRYIVGEPLRIAAVMRNVGTDEARVIGEQYLTPNMELMCLEVTFPSGVVERRQTQYIHYTEIPNPHYIGEPLTPGDAVWCVVYPNTTRRVGNSLVHTRTFPTAGSYQIRLVLPLPSWAERLTCAGLEIHSDVATLEFREPNDAEAEVIAAFWLDDGWALSVAADIPIPDAVDRDVLRSVIDRHPDLEVTKHARLLLSRAIVDNVFPGVLRDEEAASMLRAMRSEAPEFWPEEVSLHLIRALRAQRRRPEALREALRAIELNPLLESNEQFMMMTLAAACEYQQSIGAPELAVEEWREARRQGGDYNAVRKIRDVFATDTNSDN